MTNETERMSAERRVKAKWPDAWCSATGSQSGGPFYCIMVPHHKPVENVGGWKRSEVEAWQDATSQIVVMERCPKARARLRGQKIGGQRWVIVEGSYMKEIGRGAFEAEAWSDAASRLKGPQ